MNRVSLCAWSVTALFAITTLPGCGLGLFGDVRAEDRYGRSVEEVAADLASVSALVEGRLENAVDMTDDAVADLMVELLAMEAVTSVSMTPMGRHMTYELDSGVRGVVFVDTSLVLAERTFASLPEAPGVPLGLKPQNTEVFLEEIAEDLVVTSSGVSNLATSVHNERALVLVPYAWQGGIQNWLPWSKPVEQHVPDLLRQAGFSVDVRANTSASDQNLALDHFLEFDEYGVVVLGTHGATLWNGTVVLDTGIAATHAVLDEYSSEIASGEFLISGNNTLTITSTWLRNRYPSGLDRTLIVVAACESAGSSELSDALVGRDTAFLGWDDVVEVTFMERSTKRFLEHLVHDRQSVATAFFQLGSDGLARWTPVLQQIATPLTWLEPAELQLVGNGNVRLVDGWPHPTVTSRMGILNTGGDLRFNYFGIVEYADEGIGLPILVSVDGPGGMHREVSTGEGYCITGFFFYEYQFSTGVYTAQGTIGAHGFSASLRVDADDALPTVRTLFAHEEEGYIQFTWDEVESATTYRVIVIDAATSQALHDTMTYYTRHAVPDTVIPLGRSYEVFVVAYSDPGPFDIGRPLIQHNWSSSTFGLER